MPNPIEVGHFTQKDFDELGLSEFEINNSYQPSSGGVFHFKGEEGKAKTCLLAHFYRYQIDIGYYTPFDSTGNMGFKGKYGIGYTVRKGDDLREYLWLLTHKPLRHKFIIIDEIDSEFPARDSQDKEQGEIARRMWHIQKLDNIVCYTSHVETDDDRGSTDVVFHLASHYDIFPQGVNWDTQQIPYIVKNRLKNMQLSIGVANDVLRTMLIYNRREITENTLEDGNLLRPSVVKRMQEAKKRTKKERASVFQDALDMGFTEDI